MCWLEAERIAAQNWTLSGRENLLRRGRARRASGGDKDLRPEVAVVGYDIKLIGGQPRFAVIRLPASGNSSVRIFV